ncbi:MAG: hypothetical protein WC791_01565 [Candidatus Paceibacterota bacterium]|jgi:DNA polymerase III delta subunit
MLHIIYGKDREKGRVKFRALRDSLGKKYTEERLVVEGEVSDGFLDTVAVSQGLFGGVTLFVFDSVFDKKAEQEMLLAHAEELSASSNYFLILEPLLEKSIADGLKDAGVEIEECVGKKVDSRPDFNIFSLSDALGARNKKELWVLYQEALGNGLSAEEISGTLFWAVKNIALMKNAKQGDDCGVSPFVAKKTRGYAANYSEEEIVKLSRALVTMYHEAHRGGEPMEIAIERFVLSL